jgi:hypothetical protein
VLAIVFAPLQPGNFTGEIIVSTNDATSSNIVSLAGTGTASVPADFGLTISPSSLTVTSGGTANYTLSVTPAGGFNQAVALTCSGAPTASSCTVAPASVTLDGVNSSQASINVTTIAQTSSSAIRPQWIPFGPLTGTPVILVLTWPVVWLRRRGLSCRNLTVAIVFVLLSSGVVSCGGGSSSSPPATVSQGTPPGTYSLTVTGTSASISAHGATFTLVVQ